MDDSKAIAWYFRAPHFCILVILNLFLLLSNAANAGVCPPVGSDSDCGVIITISDAGATLSISNQGPYDDIEDTLIGVVNNSKQPISSLNLKGSQAIFSFDGDGIATYGIPGNAHDDTGYGGPNAYFTNYTDNTGTVNFITPIAANGGTGYFSLEYALDEATACSSILNHSLVMPKGGGNEIYAIFSPSQGYTLAQAAKICGFIAFDWQSTITELPLPNPFYSADDTKNSLHAPPAFNDPPPNGYAYQNPPNAVKLPVYYNLFLDESDSRSLAAHETDTVLYFYDAPADSCLPGGKGIGCGGLTAPSGSKIAFTTHLVGITGMLPGVGVQDTGIGFSWTDTFNGTSGGISVLSNDQQVDPNSGTGSVEITKVNNVTGYQYPKSVSVTAINNSPAAESTSNLQLISRDKVSTTSSGLIYSRVRKTFSGSVTITNISNDTMNGPFQIVLDSLTSGVTLKNATNTFGGWPYITVPVVSTLEPGQSVSASVEFENPSFLKINFTPLIYSGSFN